MGEYRCPVKDKIKPKNHDNTHGDWFSSTCPVLREAIKDAAGAENYERLVRLVGLYLKHFRGDRPLDAAIADIIYDCFIPSSLPKGYDPDGCPDCSDE